MRWSWSSKRFLATALEPALALLHQTLRLLSGRWPRPSLEPVERILVVRLDAFGDVLLSEPAIAALRRRYPKARLDVVAGGPGRELLSHHPAIDRFWHYRAPWHAAWWGQPVRWPQEPGKLWALLRQLRAQRYDLGVELRGDIRDLFFTALAGPRTVVGSPIRGGRGLLDRAGPTTIEGHRVEFGLAIAAAAGAAPEPRAPRLYLSVEARQRAGELLPADVSTWLAFHLGSGFPSKCLPVETFAQAARLLYAPDERKGHGIVLVGGPEERPLARRFQELVPFPVLDLVGRTALLETAAILERCALFIGNDSGPMHLAAAVGLPVVACFGPSLPAHYRPYSVPHRVVEVALWCRPCDHVHCVQRRYGREYLCMTSIPAHAVARAAEELLRTTRVPVETG